MKKFEFSYYNEKEFEEFLDKLPVKEMEKLILRISNIEEAGFRISSRQKWTKKLVGYVNLLEIRSNFSNDIIRALFFHSSTGQYVITHAFKKKSQKTPLSEINKALSRMKDYEKKNGGKD
ncbi:type II toxin-antitoxin system RelE/ParE family toxin [Lactobacillus sp. PV037]|uniref:type II toxin-antitoxin system RelE/ParE family toxin n=1 Tax=unclassified Lactobacillus TaxID=2620435 RepID=UPI0022402843|nr:MULTISPECIES: type II toxin-antitoxin system RelE/ParE family toxin [unclassified Lactobacillus]QNQ82232.1 type II toxin-antitoxin system RelE/ParE family toxin [Lactobacillus sp. PV012]QNQ83657.1 type II toxin-antitoxin system RelE/ParE family toxin [Lactobacillus sp. PV037]